MISSGEMVTGADVQELRDVLGFSVLDMAWLTGSLNHLQLLSEHRLDEPVRSVSASTLIRYFDRFPEKNPVPQMPTADEMYKRIEPLWPQIRDGERFSLRKFGLLFGVAPSSGSRWLSDGEPTLTIRRMFWVVLRAIEGEGVAGLRRFVETVEQEAIARGLDGLDGLFQARTWGVRE